MAQSDIAATNANLNELATELAFDEEAYERALELANLSPSKTDWVRYLNAFLLAVGSALVVAGITAFFAWNWAELGHMQKFALVQLGIVAAVVGTWRLGVDTIGGRACLFGAAFLVGVLFAVYGQVYQTGADPYSLFLTWAILIAPWALIGRQQGVWFLFVVLLNLSLIMYWTQVLEPPEGLWQLAQLLGPIIWLGSLFTDSELSSAVFLLNATALVAWEVFSQRGVPWMQGRWFARIVAFIALGTVVVPTLVIIMAATFGEKLGLTLLSPLLLAVATVTCVLYYQYRRHDLFILTCCALAVIMVLTSFAIRTVLDDFGSMLFLAMLLIAQVAAAAWWLRGVARRWEVAA